MRITRLTLLVCAAISAESPAIAEISVGSTSQLSLSTANQAPAGPSSEPAISANGRYVAFTSGAPDILPGQSDAFRDVFIRDIQKGSVFQASVNTAGSGGQGDSAHGAISPILPDGTYVIAFDSTASNLGTNPNISGTHVYLRYPKLGITEVLTSPVVAGAAGPNTHPSAAIVRDSKGDLVARVAYVSEAEDLEEGDTNQFADIYVTEFKLPKTSNYDRATQTVAVKRVRTSSGQQTDGPSESPQISGDGQHIVFVSSAPNLNPDVVSGSPIKQIYTVDSALHQLVLVSKSSNGQSADSDCFSPSISYNGRYITYVTTASNIVSVPGPESYTVIRYDTQSGTSERVNVDASGTNLGSNALAASISANGRLVTFSDRTSTLVSGDNNDQDDIFVKDMERGDLVRISVGPGGAEANQFSETPVIAGATFSSLNLTGIYSSYATNLTNPSTSTTLSDVYATSITLQPPPLSQDSSVDVPPDVKIGSKNLTFTVEKFVLPQNQATVAASSRLTVRYQFEITRKTKVNGSSRTSRINLIGKRNKITLARSKGTYTVRNRVLAVKVSNGKTQFKTGYSPRQRFTVS